MKALHRLTGLLIVLLIPLTAFAGTFNDVPEDDDNRAAIEYLAYVGTLEGYSDGTFGGENTINRAELMKVLVAGQGLAPSVDDYNNCSTKIKAIAFLKHFVAV